jgi:triosephosphate isomerase
MKISAAILTVVVGSATAFAPQVANVRTETSLFGRKPFITGNWKLNPTTKDEAVSLATGIADAVTDESPGDVALFVPYPYLESVQAAVDGKVTIGAEVRLSTYM